MVSASRVLCLLAGVTGSRAMQMSVRHHKSEPKTELVATKPACSPLRNFGTYSTVRVEVGTPAQAFDLVADTGSNNVIVLSCECKKSGSCVGDEKHCFQGTDKSSTFKLAKEKNGDLSGTTLSFGSGDIQTVIASDVVTVGGSKAVLEEGLLLMVDKQLDFDGSFEGILGLGIPQGKHSEFYERGQVLPEFLGASKVSSFSMCFNDGADGVLRLDATPEGGQSLGSVGKEHWGLGFNGISIGKTKYTETRICSRHDMQKGQDTPCGAIPDSGTTAIQAPEKALMPLFDGICDEWSRCRKLASESKKPKSHLLMALLEDCASWLSEERGLNELPKLTFHVTGTNGDEELLKLNGWAYVLETFEADVHHSREKLAAMLSLPAGPIKSKSSDRRVCVPAFQPMEMPTVANGDVWILGTPFFYQYDVHYNLAQAPPAITFSPSACGSCDHASSLFATARSDDTTRAPRHVAGAWRSPRVNVSRGL